MDKAASAKPKTVEDYVAAQPQAVQDRLGAVRAVFRAAAPDVVETLSYGIIKFAFGGSFLYLGAWKSHLGLYPVYPDFGTLEPEVAPYRAAKDTLQFRYDRPLPLDLVTRIVKARQAAARD